MLGTGTGTVVVWQKLDRVLPPPAPMADGPSGASRCWWTSTKRHLAMVFHRFLTGENGAPRISIRVNGDKVRAWDPFVRHEPGTQQLSTPAVRTGERRRSWIGRAPPLHPAR